MSASAYLLITNLFLVADGSQAGYGGADTEMEKFEIKAQCEIARNVFLNDMKVTVNEISGKISGVNAQVTRKAKCVNLNPVASIQSVGAITLVSQPNGGFNAYRNGVEIDYNAINPELKNSNNVKFIIPKSNYYKYDNKAVDTLHDQMIEKSDVLHNQMIEKVNTPHDGMKN